MGTGFLGWILEAMCVIASLSSAGAVHGFTVGTPQKAPLLELGQGQKRRKMARCTW